MQSIEAARSSMGPENFHVLRAGQTGQGMTEYIIIVALIAVAAIGTYSLLGQTVRNQTAGLALEIAGQTAQTATAAANTNATQASTKAEKRKGLKDYHDGNTN